MNDADLATELGFHSEHADVNGTTLHYVTGGEGPPLVLLPGWPQTWWSWHKVMPKLAERRRVVAVDLRGMGGSAKPDGGYDKKTMAADIHELVRRLGHNQVDVAGHDIGAMVAFSMAANHPDTVGKVALLDAPHANAAFYQLPLLSDTGAPGDYWWFGFNQLDTLPEQLLDGRARFLVDHIVDRLAAHRAAIADRDRMIYAAAYDAPGAVRASTGWYRAFRQDIADLGGYEKVTAPVLALFNRRALGVVSAMIDQYAADVRTRAVEDSGHFLAEEQPDVVVDELLAFFG